MASLLKDRTTPSGAAPQPADGGAPVTTVNHACEACGAAMQRGQDWCLECGTAAPGRLGSRPGWRAAFTVVSVTLLLVVGAVLASYAALTSDAERTAAAPPIGSGQPIPAAGTPATLPPAALNPGATGPNTTQPLVPPPPVAGNGKTIIPVTPPAAGANQQVAPPATINPPPPPPPPAAANTTKAPKATTGSQNATTAAVPKPEIVKFRLDAAKTYDPAKRAGAEFGPAMNAVDKSKLTVWDVVVPADGKPIAAGLMVDLGKPYALRSLQIATSTPGFGVEIYAARSAKQTPVDILDKRWEHLTDIKSVGHDKTVSLLNKSKDKHQLLLVYVTLPADQADPRVAIGKLTVSGTP